MRQKIGEQLELALDSRGEAPSVWGRCLGFNQGEPVFSPESGCLGSS